MVRKGFCAAILRVSPETVEKTEMLPTHLQRGIEKAAEKGIVFSGQKT